MHSEDIRQPIQADEVQTRAHTLVLMPGLDGTGLLFERFVAALPKEFEVRIVRYPNNGTPSLPDYAAFVGNMHTNGDVTLVAESFSGLVALELLRNVGVSLDRVIFVASFAESPRPYLGKLLSLAPLLSRTINVLPKPLWRMFCLGPDAPSTDVERLKDILSQVSPATIAHRLRLVGAARSEPGPLIGVPAFYLQASADRLVPASAAVSMSRRFANFTVIQVLGPHFLLQAAPKVCAAAITRIVLGTQD